MKKALIIGSVILIFLFIAVHFAEPMVGRLKIIPVDFVPNKESTVDLRSQIDGLEAKYSADCEKLLAVFLSDLEKNIDPDFVKANSAIPGVIGDLCKFNVCVKLCYKAAKDKIKGTHDFEDAYKATMDASIIQPCVHANAVASDMLQTLQVRLKERHAQYVTELATACNNNASDGNISSKALETLQNSLNTFEGTIKKAHCEKVLAGVGIAFEVFFIRETCKYIIKLSLLIINQIISDLICR